MGIFRDGSGATAAGRTGCRTNPAADARSWQCHGGIGTHVQGQPAHAYLYVPSGFAPQLSVSPILPCQHLTDQANWHA